MCGCTETYETRICAASGGTAVVNFTVLITDLFIAVCSHTTLVVFLTFHTPHSLIFFFFFTKSSRQTVTHRTCDFFFLFCRPVNFGKCGVCCRRQGSSSHLSVQIACKLFNSHCGKQDRTPRVGFFFFLSSWHGHRPPTSPDDNVRRPRQTRPTTLHMY